MATGTIPNPVRGNGREIRKWTLSFNPNGVSDPATTNIPGAIAVVTRTGVGAYRVRFNAGLIGSLSQVVYRNAHLSFDAVTPNRALIGTLTANSDGTFDVAVLHVDAAGAAVEVAANAARVTSVEIHTEEALI